MSCRVVQTDQAPAAIGPYSQAIGVGQWLFVSGQIGLAPGTGELVGGGLLQEARQVFRNLTEILKAGGFQLTDVVSVDVFVTDIAQFASFNELYGELFSEHKPARAVVEVKGLPRGASVEVKCIAFRHE